MLSLLLAAALLLGAFLPAALAEERESAKEYYVYTENGKPLTVRESPNGEIVGMLPVGTKVELTDIYDGYWAVITFHYSHSESGEGDWPAYLNRRFLITVDPADLETLAASETPSTAGDILENINAEFASAVPVEPYMITVRPARVTSWVNMRWIPSESGMIIYQYIATEELRVLQEMDHYLQVQDPDTGYVGYIHKRFAAR